MGGTSTKQQTVTTNPWAPAAQAVTPAINAAKGLTFDAQGNLIAPEGDLQKGVMQARYDYAMNDPMQSAAMGYYSDILSGQTNPYLDRMFGQASDAIRSKLDSQFAAAGRYGSSDHAREMQQGYNDLATNLYGGQYQSDQARMMQAAQLAPAAGYQGFAQQLGAAQGLENFDYEQAMSRLNDYLGMTSPLLGAGQTQTQPITRNRTLETVGAISGLLGGVGSFMGGMK